MELEVPIRLVFNPDWSMVPPRIIVEGINAGDILTGKTDLKATIE